VALYWLAYEITGSAWALGILGFCEAVPRLLLGAVGGVIVDRYDRLRLLTAIQFSLLHSGLWSCRSLFSRNLAVLAYGAAGNYLRKHAQHESDGGTIDTARAGA
jgi:hypothetical protein